MLDYARDLGVALQLTNILRDVGVDYRRGRVYLPLEDLARFGCTEDDIAREVEQRRPRRAVAAACARVLEHQAARARVFFARAVARAADRRTRAVRRRRDHARDLLRAAAPDRGRRTSTCSRRVIRVPRPRAGAARARAPGGRAADDRCSRVPAATRTSSSSAPASPASAPPCVWRPPGARVVVVEEAPRLGGRATAFTDRETGERVDNGQHVLFGCYRETYAFLRRIGTARPRAAPAALAV